MDLGSSQDDTACVTETFWPSLKGILRANPEKFNSMKLECGICQDIISVDRDYLSTNGCPGIDILPCGHIFGHHCVDQWLQLHNAQCPTCKESPFHNDCPHMADMYPLTHISDINKVPDTSHEGGYFEDNCLTCHLKTHINDLAETFARRLSFDSLKKIDDFCVVRVLKEWGPSVDILFDLTPRIQPGRQRATIQLPDEFKTLNTLVMIEGPLLEEANRIIPFGSQNRGVYRRDGSLQGPSWEPAVTRLQLGIPAYENITEDIIDQIHEESRWEAQRVYLP